MVRVRPNIVTSFNVPIPHDPDGRSEADALRIGGDWTPGVCVVKKHGIPFTWQVQKGWGYSGAYSVFTGVDLATFETEFTVWRQDQIDAWDAWAKKYLVKEPQQPQTSTSTLSPVPGPGGQPQYAPTNAFLQNVPRPKALGIYHPFLAELGISAVVPKLVGGWHAVGQPPQRWTKEIQWLQFRAPKPAVGKPKEKVPDTKKSPIIAVDAAQLEMRAKRQDVEARLSAVASHHR